MHPSEAFVVWFGDKVLLMIDGSVPPEEDDLVVELKASVVAAGVSPDDIEVIWKPTARAVAHGTSL